VDGWVIDTVSIVHTRRQIPEIVRTRVLDELTTRVNQQVLLYPPEVLGELARAADDIKRRSSADLPFDWARTNAPTATRYGHLYEGAKQVLVRVPNLIDPEKVSVGAVDEADPYVIALALQLKGAGHDMTIITDDVQTKPKKMSLADAAGVFRLPSVTLRTFLITEGIWDGKEGL
jgi:hypothetical protein